MMFSPMLKGRKSSNVLEMCHAIGEANVLHMIFKQYHGYHKFGVTKHIKWDKFHRFNRNKQK